LNSYTHHDERRALKSTAVTDFLAFTPLAAAIGVVRIGTGPDHRGEVDGDFRHAGAAPSAQLVLANGSVSPASTGSWAMIRTERSHPDVDLSSLTAAAA
jgi:hypothetical protein